MIVGIVMLMAASYQTLSTGIRPFDAMRRFLHPSFAWAWAISTVVATVIWHLPQYALAAGVTEDIFSLVIGKQLSGWSRNSLLVGISLLILIVSTAISWNYGRGWRGVKVYERMLKSFILLIIRGEAKENQFNCLSPKGLS
jgi:hypothetical protein